MVIVDYYVNVRIELLDYQDFLDYLVPVLSWSVRLKSDRVLNFLIFGHSFRSIVVVGSRRELEDSFVLLNLKDLGLIFVHELI